MQSDSQHSWESPSSNASLSDRLVCWVSASCRNDAFSVGCGADREGWGREQQSLVSAHLCGPLCGIWQHGGSFPCAKTIEEVIFVVAFFEGQDLSSQLWLPNLIPALSYYLQYQTVEKKSLETHKALCGCTNSPEGCAANQIKPTGVQTEELMRPKKLGKHGLGPVDRDRAQWLRMRHLEDLGWILTKASLWVWSNKST